MSLRISLGSESNKVPFVSARIFVGRPFYSSVVAVQFGKITAQSNALFLGCSGFQLRHAYLVAVL